MSKVIDSILVTGGSGFIGTNLIEVLLLNNYKVINFDKVRPIKTSHSKLWIEGDIMDSKKLEKIFAELLPTIVIHLAARTDTLSDNIDDYLENSIGTKNILDVIKRTNSVRKVIITSTQYVYKSSEKPFPENNDEFIPHTAYGKSKVLAERFTKDANLDCVWTIIRPTNIWGPWHMRYPNELWKVIDKGLYFHPVNHEVIRTYGYVKNIVHQIYQIMISSANIVNHQVFYIGDAPIDSYVWLNEISIQLTNKKIKRLPKFLFQTIAYVGDMMRIFKIPFPLYSKRFQNMVEDYPAPTALTIEQFGVAEQDLKKNVAETLTWLRNDGKHYFDYWMKK